MFVHLDLPTSPLSPSPSLSLLPHLEEVAVEGLGVGVVVGAWQAAGGGECGRGAAGGQRGCGRGRKVQVSVGECGWKWAAGARACVVCEKAKNGKVDTVRANVLCARMEGSAPTPTPTHSPGVVMNLTYSSSHFLSSYLCVCRVGGCVCMCVCVCVCVCTAHGMPQQLTRHNTAAQLRSYTMHY